MILDLDLDGVVRHFDPAHVDSVEEGHGLRREILTATAFAPELVERVITGRIRRIDWVQEVGERAGDPIAASEWMAVTEPWTNFTDDSASSSIGAVEIGMTAHLFEGIVSSADTSPRRGSVRLTIEYQLCGLLTCAKQIDPSDP